MGKKRPSKTPKARTKANLTLRSLTPKELASLDAMKKEARIATDAGAIARAITDWHLLRSRNKSAEERYEELELLVSNHVAASDRAVRAMDEESKTLAGLIAFAKRPGVVPRQLRIASNDY